MHRHNIIGFVRLENLLFGLIWTPMVKSPPTTGGARLATNAAGLPQTTRTSTGIDTSSVANLGSGHSGLPRIDIRRGDFCLRPNSASVTFRETSAPAEAANWPLGRHASEPGFAVRMQNSAMLRRPGEYPPSASSEF